MFYLSCCRLGRQRTLHATCVLSRRNFWAQSLLENSLSLEKLGGNVCASGLAALHAAFPGGTDAS